jgi:hypothetical protein
MLTLEVDLDINKGEPTEFRPTVELPIKKLLAICLADAGVRRDDIDRIITDAMKKVLHEGGKMTDFIEATQNALDDVENLLDRLPARAREGQTRVDGTVTIASFIESLPAMPVQA